MTEKGLVLSKEKQINNIFAQIAGVPDPETRIAILGSGIAEPGDLLFFITHHPDKHSLYKNRPRTLKEFLKKPLEPFFRRCYGFAKNDFDEWHVGIYFMGRKRKDHQRINLWMFHSHPPSTKEVDPEKLDFRRRQPSPLFFETIEASSKFGAKSLLPTAAACGSSSQRRSGWH